MAIPQLPKLFDGKGLPAALEPLANRVQEWTSGTQDVVRSLREFAEKTDFFNALRINGIPVQRTKPTDGQVLTVEKGATEANWADAAAGYTDAQAQNAVTGLFQDTTTVEWTIVPNTSIEANVPDFTGDSGAGGAPGAVPAPAAGDAAANKVLGAGGGWVTQSIGSTVTIWMPEAPPASPHSMDDEFTAGSIDAKWTDYDFGGFVTNSISTTRQALLMTAGTPSGGTQLAGMYQAVPSGSEWAVYTKVFVIGTDAANVNPGILLLEDGASSTADGRIIYSRLHSGDGAGMLWTTAYNTNLGASDVTSRGRIFYLCLRVNGTNLAADASVDGKHWVRTAMVARTFTAAHVGVGMNCATGVGSIAGFEFFRVFEFSGASAVDATYLGRLANVGV